MPVDSSASFNVTAAKAELGVLRQGSDWAGTGRYTRDLEAAYVRIAQDSPAT